jgi:uncharacterized membrane protein YeaQ/YmgE (transglycosylase-associated protein family)
MIGVLLAFYPAQWRRRYGEEFRAVLESRPLGPFDVADVLLGALDARTRALRMAGLPENDGGHLTMLRIGGLGAAVGGVAWVAGWFGASLSGDASRGPWLPLVMLGTVGVLLGITGLSAFQAHREPRLAWAAFLLPALGSVVSLVGLAGMISRGDEPWVGSWSGWSVWALGSLATLLGSVLFAAATIRAAVLSRRAAFGLLITSAYVIVLLSGSGGDGLLGRIFAALCVFSFGGSWVWLGVTALRRGPIRAIQPA